MLSLNLNFGWGFCIAGMDAAEFRTTAISIPNMHTLQAPGGGERSTAVGASSTA